jgi:hypothetical protein
MNQTIQDRVFLQFMALRFPNVVKNESYWAEWKARFAAGTEWTQSDSKSKAVLAGICPLYATEKKSFGICNAPGCAKKGTKKAGSLAYCKEHFEEIQRGN